MAGNHDNQPAGLVQALMQLPAAVALTAGTEHRLRLVNRRLADGVPRGDLVGKTMSEAFPGLAGDAFLATMDRVYSSGGSEVLVDHPIVRPPNDGASVPPRWFTIYFEPLHGGDHGVDGVLMLAFDVTEHVLARHRVAASRAAEQRSESRFHMAVTAAELGAWHCELPFDELSWDRRAREHFGVPADRRITLDDFYALLHPDDREETRAAIDAAIARRQAYDIEYRTIGPDDGPTPGRVRWIRAIGRVTFDGERPSRFDGVTIDVTDRRGAEADLARTRRQLDIILANVAEGVTAHDRDGRLLFGNDAAARIAGYEGAAALLADGGARLLGSGPALGEDGSLIAPEQLPVRLALDGAAAERALLIKAEPTAEERWVEVTSTPVLDRDGAVELVVSVHRDITERRRAEDGHRFLIEASALLGSSLDYEATLRRVAQLAVPRLADWCVVSVPAVEGHEEMLEVAHTDPSRVALAHHLQKKYRAFSEASAGHAALLRTGQPQLFREISDELLVAGARDAQHLALLRELGPRSAMVLPIVGPHRVMGTVWLASAESGRRFGDKDLALAGDLAARAALAVENATLYGEAQRAVRLRDDFLSIAGHELRTPLTALQLQLQALQRASMRTPPLEPSVVGDRLGMAIGHVERLERLIGELLDVSRITTGRLAMQVEEVDLVSLAREVIDRFNDEAAGRRGAPVTLLGPGGAVVGRWDRMRVEQVLSNLVSNAIKYGAGKPVTVALDGDSGGAIAKIVVVDHGIGIGAVDQERIFGRFERAVSSRHYGGLGLGLWIVRQIVEAQGGTIAVRSEPGVETVFTVELPRG